jgi:L-histidine Nalpha-methyltransferase
LSEEQRFEDEFARDVRAGLTSPRKRLACRWFYDAEGSELFEEICEVPEYYIPAAEREILAERADEIAAQVPEDCDVVEFGSGSAKKTRLLLDALLRRGGAVRYLPIDICAEALEDSARSLAADYPGLEVAPLRAEYEEGVGRLSRGARPKLVLWLGSNIGNLDRTAAARFLARVAGALDGEDRVLVGIDLRKDAATIERAYDDSLGVTARFNLNLLARVNRQLGGRFDLARFRHRAVWVEDAGRVEMHLVSLDDVRVPVEALGIEVPLAAGESIHTEDSYKYSPGEIESLAREARLRIAHRWTDRRALFSETLFAPAARS